MFSTKLVWHSWLCCHRIVRMFFFFKQKTAYEMRISDWSSDVCSSDLRHALAAIHVARRGAVFRVHRRQFERRRLGGGRLDQRRALARLDHEGVARLAQRSEEHTSELQSLMRISYAVFCLKKKKKQKITQQHIHIMQY